MRLAKLFTLSVLITLLCWQSSYSQLTVTPSQPAAVLAGKLAGPGITISAPTLNCAGVANGTFTSVTTPITIDSGIVLTSGRAINTAGLESSLASFNNGMPGDAALTTLAGTTTFDACVLEFDFVPKGDTVSFNYQFGSEEYTNSTCGQYNDAFAFFISGPGIAGTDNMALVPGTNIPVTVNSINSGIPGPPGWPGFCDIANCTSMGPGSPFTTFFVNNAGGTQVTYRGYTRSLRAFHAVTPCVTYHLKLTIADGANSLYDSGVFIEAGSLSTNTYKFKRSDSIGHTLGGVPNAIMRGCAPAGITVLNSKTTTLPQKVYLTYAGTGVKGLDFNAPDSVTIMPGDTSVLFNVSGLTSATGTKSITIYLSSPFSCGIIDTLLLNLLDPPSANIVTNDTSICLGKFFQIIVNGTPGLTYNWTPAAGLSSAIVKQPITTPTANIKYYMAANFPLSGCPTITDSIRVTVDAAVLAITTPDTTICRGDGLRIVVSDPTGLTFNWTPAAGLDNPTFYSPIAAPASTTTYSVTATSTIGGCPAFGNITITVVDPVVNILTPNSAICPGGSLNLSVSGPATAIYQWIPDAGLNDATLLEPIASPSVAMTYTVIATDTALGCKNSDVVNISILPPVFAIAKGSRTACLDEAISLESYPGGNTHSYSWAGPNGYTSTVQNPFIPSSTLLDAGIYTVTVTNLVTGCSGSDTAVIRVGDKTMSLVNVTPNQTIELGMSVRLNADNGVTYRWEPNDGSIDNPGINNPVATPTITTTYRVYATDTNGCVDMDSVVITVDNRTGIFVASAFTPNGDGLNDIFRVNGKGEFTVVEMAVFNRWGENVFRSTSGNKGWDGTFNGQPAEIGTYNYIIILHTPYKDNETLKGTVTLIR